MGEEDTESLIHPIQQENLKKLSLLCLLHFCLLREPVLLYLVFFDHLNKSLILKNERGLNYLAQCAVSSTLGREIGIEC